MGNADVESCAPIELDAVVSAETKCHRWRWGLRPTRDALKHSEKDCGQTSATMLRFGCQMTYEHQCLVINGRDLNDDGSRKVAMAILDDADSVSRKHPPCGDR